MNVAMDEAVVVHMSYSTCQLAEYEEETRCGEVGLAKLLPEVDVFRALSFEHNGTPLWNVYKTFMEI